jgi:DNA polymerase
MNKIINQKILSLIEYYNLLNINLLINNFPINRFNNNEKSSNSLEKSKRLEDLKKMIKAIKNCELKNSAHKMVFSDGNINSKIMLIGEGPGVQEDQEGLPFVGLAGKLLNKMLGSINLNRKKVYISNVVNYRPPNNRRPSDQEIERYYPFLKLHIEIINPKILVLLGSTALNAIIGNDKVISKARGKWMRKKIGNCDPYIMPSFHPAFLMRQPDQKKLAWTDLKLIREKMKQLNF